MRKCATACKGPGAPQGRGGGQGRIDVRQRYTGEMAEWFKAAVLKTVVGSVAEWSIAPVLKTGNGQPFVSSNLTASARENSAGILSMRKKNGP